MDVFGYLLKVGLASVVLSAVLFITLLILKKKGIAPFEGKEIKVKDAVKVGPKAYLVSVEWRGRKFLIGISGDKMFHLSSTYTNGISEKEPMPALTQISEKFIQPSEKSHLVSPGVKNRAK